MINYYKYRELLKKASEVNFVVRQIGSENKYKKYLKQTNK